MKVSRALVALLLLCSALAGSLVAQSRSVAAAAEPATAVALVPPAEDAPTQTRAFSQAYNLLLDYYVHRLDSGALSRAAWDELVLEANGKAAAPGPTPSFSGDRPADLATMRNALTVYISRPNSSPDGFIAAHALIRGMVHYVDEAHTYFLDPQRYKEYLAWSRGDSTYVGIGVTISTRDGQPRIVSVFEDTPAMAAGLQPGDVLVQINDKPAADLALDGVASLTYGPTGTTVQVIVRRGDDPTPLPFTIQRAEIHLQFVRNKLVGDDIGYVSLRGFPEPSVVDTVERDVSDFLQAGVHGLVLDLRGNAGGRVDVGARLLSDFLPPGTNIYEQIDGAGGSRTQMTSGGKRYGLPLVVLVDAGTASMGEIFAAAVQEHGAAVVVGSPTSGSVAGAEAFGLGDGSGLQVTVFEMLSSEGRPLNKVGVQPDEVVDTSSAESSVGADQALARAVQILHDRNATQGTSAGVVQRS